MTDPDRDHTTVVHTERKSSGGLIATVVLLLLILVVAFFLFGDQLGGEEATEPADIQVEVDPPATGNAG